MQKGKNQAALKKTSQFRPRFRNWGCLLLLLFENRSRRRRPWPRFKIRAHPLHLLLKSWSGRRHPWLRFKNWGHPLLLLPKSLGRCRHPWFLTLLSPPRPDIKAKGLSGAAVAQPLTALPITVWNPPSDKAKSPPRGTVELKRKKLKPKADAVRDSLLSNAELAAGAISSILRESDLGRSKELLVNEALALSFQGVASVSL